MPEPKYITRQRESDEKAEKSARKYRSKSIRREVGQKLGAEVQFCDDTNRAFYLVDRQGERLLPVPCVIAYEDLDHPNIFGKKVRVARIIPIARGDLQGSELKTPTDVVEFYDALQKTQIETEEH